MTTIRPNKVLTFNLRLHFLQFSPCNLKSAFFDNIDKISRIALAENFVVDFIIKHVEPLNQLFEIEHTQFLYYWLSHKEVKFLLKFFDFNVPQHFVIVLLIDSCKEALAVTLDGGRSFLIIYQSKLTKGVTRLERVDVQIPL